MRACLCGVSGYGSTHYDDLMREHEAGRCEIVAATIINQDEEAEKCARLREIGCDIFDDYHAMLAAASGRAEICWLPVGIALHAPFSIAAMQAGMNVFVEKPLAGTIEDARAIMEVEQATGRWTAVGYQDMYQSDTRRIKQAILDGRLGEVRIVKCGACWPRSQSYYNRNNWAGKLKVGKTWILDSPFNNALAHQLNQMCCIAGAGREDVCTPTSIRAELYHANDIPSADTACLQIETAEGPQLLFTVTHACRQSIHPDVVVRGTQGTLTWVFRKEMRIDGVDGSTEDLGVESERNYRRNVFDALQAKLDDPAAEVFTADQAAAQTLCVNAAHAASPIYAVPEDFVDVEPHEESTVTVIDGIEELVSRSIAEEKSFAELGAPWAKSAQPFDIREMTTFPGQRE